MFKKFKWKKKNKINWWTWGSPVKHFAPLLPWNSFCLTELFIVLRQFVYIHYISQAVVLWSNLTFLNNLLTSLVPPYCSNDFITSGQFSTSVDCDSSGLNIIFTLLFHLGLWSLALLIKFRRWPLILHLRRRLSISGFFFRDFGWIWCLHLWYSFA